MRDNVIIPECLHVEVAVNYTGNVPSVQFVIVVVGRVSSDVIILLCAAH